MKNQIPKSWERLLADYGFLYKKIRDTRLSPWLDTLPAKVEQNLLHSKNGDISSWIEIWNQLPDIRPTWVKLENDTVQIGKKEDCPADARKNLERLLKGYHPWRKGPYDFFGITIETEWRSDMKWGRLQSAVTPLTDRLVLDVGCGNGYHCWRMIGEGAKLAIGIDFTLLYVMQFLCVQKYIKNPSIGVLPLNIEEMPEDFDFFDTVFSMGLLYHRRAPLEHLLQLKSFLRGSGELVLETLVIDGARGEVLSPEGRYAKMPNVFFIPSVSTLEFWLKKIGFKNIRLVDVSKTTSEEQRVTEWMGFQSLSDFLDPNDPNKTIEGYPAPQRAVLLATNP